MWGLGFRVPGSRTNVESVSEALFKGMRSSIACAVKIERLIAKPRPPPSDIESESLGLFSALTLGHAGPGFRVKLRAWCP